MINQEKILQLFEEFPLLNNLKETKPFFWTNNRIKSVDEVFSILKIDRNDLKDASNRLDRFSSFLYNEFEQLKDSKGIIESPIVEAKALKDSLEQFYNKEFDGSLFLKCDHLLAISGSIKARGGFYEVLKFAEDIALENGLITLEEDYKKLSSKKCKKIFSNYSIVVGSTGNLGLSIGIMSSKIGFNVTVHMSNDAKQWKKEMLREVGVTVVEHEGDYSLAVTNARESIVDNSKTHFIDDENSIDLFMGYAVAALRLEKQLKEKNITVDEEHPLFVYLPCGVGGAPGGITWGLKNIFKDNVHCFFAEPTHSPCMLLGLYTELHEEISVNDIGIDNITQADGLAVGRASGFVGKTLENLINGCYTIEDDRLFELLALVSKSLDLKIEPSAAAGIEGAYNLSNQNGYIDSLNLKNKDNITHLAWTTGGSMVPESEMTGFIKKGENLLLNK